MLVNWDLKISMIKYFKSHIPLMFILHSFQPHHKIMGFLKSSIPLIFISFHGLFFHLSQPTITLTADPSSHRRSLPRTSPPPPLLAPLLPSLDNVKPKIRKLWVSYYVLNTTKSLFLFVINIQTWLFVGIGADRVNGTDVRNFVLYWNEENPNMILMKIIIPSSYFAIKEQNLP